MPVALTVNGAAVEAEIEPRLHLADFLREHLLLTGTHLGCEHGVCGACTLLIDGEPARSCIAFAADCGGRDIRSIEGLEDDAVMTRLREAFTAEHALQCGYCTPGMLVTARDIVRRLPDADEDRIRLELDGNLCRCTGYRGIVRAIARVLKEGAFAPIAPAEPVELMSVAIPVVQAPPGDGYRSARPSYDPPVRTGGEAALERRIALALPRDTIWAALRDPALIASCVPGAGVTEMSGDRIAGTLQAGLGPIRARFTGQGTLSYDPDRFAGHIAGEGSDATTGTRLQAHIDFQVEAVDDTGSVLVLSVRYGLRGALAQFARGPLVRAFAAEIAAQTGANLERRLSGAPQAAATRPGSLLLRSFWRWLRALAGR